MANDPTEDHTIAYILASCNLRVMEDLDYQGFAGVEGEGSIGQFGDFTVIIDAFRITLHPSDCTEPRIFELNQIS